MDESDFYQDTDLTKGLPILVSALLHAYLLVKICMCVLLIVCRVNKYAIIIFM